LPQQATEILVVTTFPARKGLAKVSRRAAQRFINLGVPAEFVPVVIGQLLDPGFNGLRALMIAKPTKSDVSLKPWLSPEMRFCALPLLRWLACVWLQ
jgi:hypothetical protein